MKKLIFGVMLSVGLMISSNSFAQSAGRYDDHQIVSPSENQVCSFLSGFGKAVMQDRQAGTSKQKVKSDIRMIESNPNSLRIYNAVIDDAWRRPIVSGTSAKASVANSFGQDVYRTCLNNL